MKRRDKSSGKRRFPAAVLRDLRDAYRALHSTACRQPWILQGSVNGVAPKSSSGNLTYTWTRKVRNKTVTVALSQEQAVAFRQAISANRRVEKDLARLREASQTALLEGLPGVTKRRLNRSEKARRKSSQKVLK